MRILISACLLGVPCRYDGESKPLQLIEELLNVHELIPFCPEIYGGLPTPRPPAERQGDRVVNAKGEDVTAAYENGASEALRLAKLFHCEAAILKSKSPSCGCGEIYDGTFSGRLRAGDGVTAALLRQNGVSVLTECEIQAELPNKKRKGL